MHSEFLVLLSKPLSPLHSRSLAASLPVGGTLSFNFLGLPISLPLSLSFWERKRGLFSSFVLLWDLLRKHRKRFPFLLCPDGFVLLRNADFYRLWHVMYCYVEYCSFGRFQIRIFPWVGKAWGPSGYNWHHPSRPGYSLSLTHMEFGISLPSPLSL